MTGPEPLNTAEHPNRWTAEHPEGCPACRVCATCFRPRLASAVDADGVCGRCLYPSRRWAK